MWIQVATQAGWSEPQDVFPAIAVSMIDGGTARACKVEQRETRPVVRAVETAVKAVVIVTKQVAQKLTGPPKHKYEDFGVCDD